VLSSKVVGTDDTPVKVLDRSLPQTRKGRIDLSDQIVQCFHVAAN
jgi:hypothetical protein